MKNESENKNQGCCPSVHAKIFEIIIIIGFILSIILLIVNLILSLWCFKCSYPLFIIEIGLLALNVFSFILSIILRIWRSNGSVLNQNFSSSKNVAIVNLVLVIINIFASIAEEVLFDFVIYFISFFIDDEIFYYYYIDLESLIQGLYEILVSEYHNNGLRDEINSLQEMWGKIYIIKQKRNKIKKIMNKNFENKLFSFLDNIEGCDKRNKKRKNNIKILKIFPWIAINFNIFIQVLMFIFIIIIITRINLKSNFGFPQSDDNQSVQNRMIDNLGDRKKKSRKKSTQTADLVSNAESVKRQLKDKKKKKRRKKSSLK